MGLNKNYLVRLGIAALIVVVCLLVLGGLLWVTQSALNVIERLAGAPAVIRYGFWVLIMAIATGFLWLAVSLLWPARREPRSEIGMPIDEAELEARVAAASQRGVDVSGAEAELARLKDSVGGTVSIGFLGEISAGKSSLIRALTPSATTEVSVLGGTTGQVQRYHWDSGGGDRITLVDLPGLGEKTDTVTLEEAQRCHLLVYVCEGDLSRPEYEALKHQLLLRKPTVVAINKSDQYTPAELEEIRGRVAERVAALASDTPVVTVVSGGSEQLIEVSDGVERALTRRRNPVVWSLSEALGEVLAGQSGVVEQLRDRAVFALAHQKLLAAEADYRRGEADSVVKSYTRKAVVGALAAISPGTDLLIQGYLATAMVRSMCRLYGQSPKDMDIEKFLDLAQQQLGKKGVTLVLAVAGNGLKAFPGVGTVAGGLVHAVAYGLVFGALGRGLKTALEADQAFGPQQAAKNFKEALDGDLQSQALEVVQLALASRTEKHQRD